LGELCSWLEGPGKRSVACSSYNYPVKPDGSNV
jgi:hypothetical protein